MNRKYKVLLGVAIFILISFLILLFKNLLSKEGFGQLIAILTFIGLIVIICITIHKINKLKDLIRKERLRRERGLK